MSTPDSDRELTSAQIAELKRQFEKAVPGMTSVFKAYLAKRYGGSLPSEELIQQSLTDLWQYQREIAVGDTDTDTEGYRNLIGRRGMVILKRRVADYFRGPRSKHEHVSYDDSVSEADPSDARLLLARISKWIAKQEEMDQILLLSGLQSGEQLTSTERTRLARLRARMKEELGIKE